MIACTCAACVRKRGTDSLPTRARRGVDRMGAAKAASILSEGFLRNGYARMGLDTWPDAVVRAWKLLWDDLDRYQRTTVLEKLMFYVQVPGRRGDVPPIPQIGLPNGHNLGCISAPSFLPWPDQALSLKKWLELDPKQVFLTTGAPRVTLNSYVQATYGPTAHGVAQIAFRQPYVVGGPQPPF